MVCDGCHIDPDGLTVKLRWLPFKMEGAGLPLWHQELGTNSQQDKIL
jgi:hypothetical protein